MAKISRLISQADARSLASMNQRSYCNDTPTPNRYFTYPDLAVTYGISGTDFDMDVTGENPFTGQVTYDAATGSWPVNKSKKMWPR
jgi:hypothetical protein